jgi:hypothetical protein
MSLALFHLDLDKICLICFVVALMRCGFELASCGIYVECQ